MTAKAATTELSITNPILAYRWLKLAGRRDEGARGRLPASPCRKRTNPRARQSAPPTATRARGAKGDAPTRLLDTLAALNDLTALG